jgi:hypothetical protein
MDLKEATGADTLLGIDRKGRQKGEQGSESPSRRRWKIKESMFVHYESVCVDSSYSTASPVKVVLIGGDVDIYQTQPGEM